MSFSGTPQTIQEQAGLNVGLEPTVLHSAQTLAIDPKQAIAHGVIRQSSCRAAYGPWLGGPTNPKLGTSSALALSPEL